MAERIGWHELPRVLREEIQTSIGAVMHADHVCHIVVAGEEYDWQPHAPGTGDQRAKQFPWARALAELNAGRTLSDDQHR